MSGTLYPKLQDRPVKETICLFDVDGTLTPARLGVSKEMLQTLSKLREQCAIGFVSTHAMRKTASVLDLSCIQVGGSDLVKQEEQLGQPSLPATGLFDFCFSENGLTYYREGEKMASHSFIQWLGEEKYQKLARFILRYLSDLEGLPRMRGTFIEFRNGMINVSPVGRNASTAERGEFEQWDKKNNCRKNMIAAIKKEFPDIGLTYVQFKITQLATTD